MNPASSHQRPRIMPLAQVAREILMLDSTRSTSLLSRGRLAGAFKVGKLWFVAFPR